MKKQRSNQENKREIKNLREYSRELVVSNEDLIIEILLHVPAKSLMRFKCVSKLWLSLISDLNFSSNHARRNSNSLVSGFYFCYKTLGLKSSFRLRSISLLDKNQSLPNFKFLVPKVGNLNMVDACNGLILFSQGAGYTVCNPTTRKYKKILPYCVVKKPKRNGKAWLAFDPSVSNQYKIIRLVHIDSSDVHEINIYSSKNSSWKRISITIENLDELENSSQVYWNKALNWVTKDHFHIRFDAEKEKLTSTPLGQIPENHVMKHLGSCHGNLILVAYNPRHLSDEDLSTCLTILEMKSNVNSSVVNCSKINIHQYSLERVIGLYSYVVKIAYGNNGHVALLLFDQNKQRYVNVWRVGGLPCGEIPSAIFNFFETLSPV